MDNTIAINKVKRAIGQLYVQVGIKQISGAISDFTDTQGTFAQFCQPLLGLPVSQLDEYYYFTSWENWQKIIDTINPILKNNGWIANRFDCDKRSYLVTALTALLFEINTVRPIYCDVQALNGVEKYMHYANVISLLDGTAVLWDVDNGGQYTKITSNPVVIKNCRYNLLAVK